MRRTVTLDPDVDALLREEIQRRGVSLDRALNAAVRRGVRDGAAPSERRFVVRARPLGLRCDLDPGALRDLDDELEIDEFRRKTRNLEHQRP